MYNDQLEPKTVPIDSVFMDPNNPRFWSEQTQRTPDIPDSKIPDATHQNRAITLIADHALGELKNSIMRNGFLPLDRIVVRPLEGMPSKYVVIEGNRRLAALIKLREEIVQGTVAETDLEEDYLVALRTSTDNLEVLIYEGSENKNIAWILQGIRHIGGIREWMPAQQGKLVADQIDKEGLSLSQAGQRFGLSAQAVGRRYRSYKALQQMRADDEFQDKADNKYYSLFEEAIRDRSVKDWLGWNDSNKLFTNTDNLKQFYSWICPDDEHEKKPRRIHDPRHIKMLGRLLTAKQFPLLEKIGLHEVSIEAAEQKLKDEDYRYDWSAAFKKIAELLGSIPNAAIDNDGDAIIAALAALESQIAKLRIKAKAVSDEDVRV